MALGAGIAMYMDLFDQMLDNLKKSAAQGVEMPLDELIDSFMPEGHDCECAMLAVTLAIAIQRLVLTAADRVH